MSLQGRFSLESTVTTVDDAKPVTLWSTVKYFQAQLDVMLQESLELTANAKDCKQHVQLLKTVFIQQTLWNMTQVMKSTVTQFNRQISEVIQKEEARIIRLRDRCQRMVEVQRKLELSLIQSKKRIDRIDAALGYSPKRKRRR